ncbi:PREDICTED: uncharacterized protein LOC105461608, partial [Wasmannia auropunctata]|uniref:uncharacterized protein LOC105461608 n=1 Tax=Wasmannia auropunctata TaxID=64793 RepID=UPI0005EFB090
PSSVPRILRRRLALTHTSYKWLDIEINAGPLSTIDLTIGDNRGNGIVLSYETWRALMDRRADVERLMQSTPTSSSSLSICDLTVRL